MKTSNDATRFQGIDRRQYITKLETTPSVQIDSISHNTYNLQKVENTERLVNSKATNLSVTFLTDVISGMASQVILRILYREHIRITLVLCNIVRVDTDTTSWKSNSIVVYAKWRQVRLVNIYLTNR